MERTFILLIALFFANSAWAGDTSLKKIRFQPDWFPNGQFAGFFAAQENAIYADHGLDVEFDTFAFGSKFLDKVAQGEAHFGTSESYILINAVASGKPLVALGAVLKRSPAGYMYLKKSGIQSAKDLSNKTVGVHAYADELLPYFIKKAQIDANTVKSIKVTNDLQQLLSGKVDLMQGYAIDEYLSLQRQTKESTGFLTFEQLGLPMYSMVLYTSRDFAENHPNIVNAFMKATASGWEDALNNPTKSAKFLSKFEYNQTTPIPHIREQIEALRPFIAPPGQEMLKTNRMFWEAMLNHFLESGLIKETITVDDIVLSF